MNVAKPSMFKEPYGQKSQGHKYCIGKHVDIIGPMFIFNSFLRFAADFVYIILWASVGTIHVNTTYDAQDELGRSICLHYWKRIKTL